MLSVAAGADRRLRHTTGDGFAMHAGFELAGDAAMAHAASLGYGGAKCRRPGALGFVRRAMAGAACGRGGVAFPDLLRVNPLRVVGNNLLMATHARRFGSVCRMRIFFMLYVAACARDRCVRPLLQFLRGVMA